MKTECGFVALVGAGPGEMGLLTLRGKELIEKADVVVYDRLVSEDILQLVPDNAQMINAGKESSKHNLTQNEINELLLVKAMQGNFVVRLKGGDPFVFGRGGEEIERLVQNHIPFEVVPGITSAISAPAFAGIPVTHRDFCSSFHIITGHQKENEPLHINFDALSQIGGTLIFLMGVSSIAQITNGLISAGMDKGTPAAVVENGTRSNQRKLIADLESLLEKSIIDNIKSPAVIIVGDVCKLSDRYDWFSKRYLFGRKIIITRPKASKGTLSKKLRELGATVYDYPCIEIKEMLDQSQLRQLLFEEKTYNWMVFSSKNGVDIVFESLKSQKQDLRILAGTKIAAIGSQTANALLGYGIVADYIPDIFDCEHLAKRLCEITDVDDSFLLLRASKGNEDLAHILKSSGRKVYEIAVYDTVYTSAYKDRIKQIVDENEHIYVTFTSASTVEGFVESTSDIDYSKITGICIGNQTAKSAEKYKIRHFVSKQATVDSMIEKILEAKNEENKA